MNKEHEQLEHSVTVYVRTYERADPVGLELPGKPLIFLECEVSHSDHIVT